MKTCKVFHVWVEGYGYQGEQCICAHCGIVRWRGEAPFWHLADLLGNVIYENDPMWEVWADLANGARTERLRSKQ